MKKFIIATAILGSVGIGLYSCNNGAYDAHPDTDNSAALNPLHSDNYGVVYLGTMEATLNKRKVLFSPAFAYEETDENGNYAMRLIARVHNDSILQRTLRITFIAEPPTTMEYLDSADAPNPIVDMSMVDTTRVDKAGRPIHIYYTINTYDGVGYGSVNIKGMEGGNLRGEFFGKLYHYKPEKKYSDTMNFELSHFYFKKVAFPLEPQYRQYVTQFTLQ